MTRVARFALVVAAASMAACGTQGAQRLEEGSASGAVRSVVSAASAAIGDSGASAASAAQGQDGVAAGEPAKKGTAVASAGSGAPTTAAGGPAAGAAGAGSPSTTAKAASPGSPPPAAAPGDDDEGVPFGNTQSPGFPLRAKVTPKCVERGQNLRIEVTTRPFASIAAAIAYSKIDSGAPYTLGAADPSGKWVWILPVGATAAYGQAWAAISAQDRSSDSNDEGAKTSGEGAAKKYPFEVKDSC
ncbi:MAG TPA: hypothetical protein VF230_14595 [Acidimicrobiales bacterium]